SQMGASRPFVENRINRVVHYLTDLCARRPGFPIQLLVLVAWLRQAHVDVHVDDREDTPRSVCDVRARAVKRPTQVEADVSQCIRLLDLVDLGFPNFVADVLFAFRTDFEVAANAFAVATATETERTHFDWYRL